MIDDLAERFLGFGLFAEFPVRQIEPAVHAQLIARGRAHGPEVEIECLPEFACLVGIDGVGNHRRRVNSFTINRVNAVTHFSGLTGLDIGVDRFIFHPYRCVRKVRRWRRVHPFQHGAGDAFRDDFVGRQIGERETNAKRFRFANGLVFERDCSEGADQHNRRLRHIA